MVSKIIDRIKSMTPGTIEYMNDTTLVIREGDGRYSVTDNGEEIFCESVYMAIVIVLENLSE